ncbi:unnamed protein product [Clavelina lepadiformis]|uniref:Uncharacterized protein n=1 Tax=Clavelina lepadiformis TaxID=159417 RepID=A0ABP0G4S4_CLALP
MQYSHQHLVTSHHICFWYIIVDVPGKEDSIIQRAVTSSHLFRDHHGCAIVLYKFRLYTNAQHYHHYMATRNRASAWDGVSFTVGFIFPSTDVQHWTYKGSAICGLNISPARLL